MFTKVNGGGGTPEGWHLHIITDDNRAQYVRLPDFVERMVKDGSMLRAHFSDILRTALLYQYGGLWVDATSLLTGKIPDFILHDRLFMFSTQSSILPISASEFENWLIRSEPRNYVLGRVLENVLSFFQATKHPHEPYFVYFYILAAIYRHDAKAKALLDDIYYWGNKDALLMHPCHGLGESCTDRKWQQLTGKCFVQKLTYKYPKEWETQQGTLLWRVLHDL